MKNQGDRMTASSSRQPLRVGILYNEPVLAVGHKEAESEHEIVFTVGEVEKYLSEGGFEVSKFGVREPGVLLQKLADARPDVVFNFFEGLATHYETESTVAGLLEWLGIPFTGSPSTTLALARNKPRTKALLRGLGLPVTDCLVINDARVPACPFDWPVIVKPAGQDASIGVDHGSVVTSQEALSRRVALMLEQFGAPVLVEPYLEGREFSVVVVECPEVSVMPASEIRFDERGPERWPIFTYDAKWLVESADFNSTPVDYPANIPPELQGRLADLARKSCAAVGIRDYGRVDFRCDASGNPHVLEVNPNPDFSPLACLASAIEDIRFMTHREFAIRLVRQAHARGGFAPRQSR